MRYGALKVVAGLAVCLAAATSVKAQATYDTTAAWNGSHFNFPFGVGNTATYGQTFVAPNAPLDSFTFYVNPTGNTISMQPEVFAWSGPLIGGAGTQGAVGPALFTGPSILINGASPANANGFVQINVNTNDLPLTAGADYVALLTVSDPADFAATTGTGEWGAVSGHPAGDGGGGFAFDNNGSNYASLNTVPWDDAFDDGDSAWTAQFGAETPEPGAFALLGGICVAGLAVRRRRSRAN